MDSALTNSTLTIGEASEASGLSTDTIRYYERIGVLPGVPRQANSYRGYSLEHVETLRFARRLRDLGCSIADMAQLLRTFHDGSCREMRETLLSVTGTLLAKVRSQRRELGRAEDQLEALAAGLGRLKPDDHRLLTLEPCGCVTLVEAENLE